MIVKQLCDSYELTGEFDVSLIPENNVDEFYESKAFNRKYTQNTKHASNSILSLSSRDESTNLQNATIEDCFIVRLVENNKLGMLYSWKELDNNFVTKYFISIENSIMNISENNGEEQSAQFIDSNSHFDRVSSLGISIQYLSVVSRRPLLVKLRRELGVIFPVEMVEVDNKSSEVSLTIVFGLELF